MEHCQGCKWDIVSTEQDDYRYVYTEMTQWKGFTLFRIRTVDRDGMLDGRNSFRWLQVVKG